MLFTFIVAATASQALGLRPASIASSRSAQFAKLRDLVAAANAHPSKNLATLHDVADVVNGIMLQSGNATEHLTAADQELLNMVIDMLNTRMYASMTRDHHGDEIELAEAIAAINQCAMDVSARFDEGGDLKDMQDSVVSYQTALDALQDDVDDKTFKNTTAWNNLQTHMSMISDAPHCLAFPSPRTMPALDVYFTSSAYAIWWTAQKAAYEPVRDAYLFADHQLREALTAYAVGLAVRDVSYCSWKREVEAACEKFSQCYEEKKAHYLNVVKPAVEEDMKMRIEAYKAGEIIIHNIKFLLAEEAVQAVGAIDTHRYQIAFLSVPAKPECDMSVLDDPRWVPTPQCHLLTPPPRIAEVQGLTLPPGVQGFILPPRIAEVQGLTLPPGVQGLTLPPRIAEVQGLTLPPGVQGLTLPPPPVVHCTEQPDGTIDCSTA